MDQLIKVINKLQDAFSAVNVSNPIDLPQITVIGSYAIEPVVVNSLYSSNSPLSSHGVLIVN